MMILYGTSACHLCEQAESMLVQQGAEFRSVDISDSDELFERYGLTIPVLQNDNGQELNWPFSPLQLAEFLARA